MKVYLDTIGCRLNQAEIEQFARQLRAAGHSLAGEAGEADLAIVNTCAVTSAAVSDSRQKIRQIERAGVPRIIATGCWATLRPEEALRLSGVSDVIANTDKDRLVADLLKVPLQVFDLEPIERQPLPGSHQRTRAFIKVQDGCNNRCTFCVTTLARGPAHSRNIQDILADVRTVGAAREVVLTGVHLGSWGQDFSPVQRLSSLIRAILEQTDVPRLRLSSLEPWDIEAEFFRLWENPRMCRHLHLPLQSGCAATLRRMARKTTPQTYAELLQAIHQIVPEMAITTDIITGFPGESEEEFKQSLDFVRQMDFAGGHVFTYSPRPGTAAAQMPGQVPIEIRKRRNAEMRAVFSQASKVYQSRFIGRVLPVLWESATAIALQDYELSGLTENYLRVRARAPENLWNQITPVRLSELRSDGLIGQI